ncbi:MAG TPA: hypothetical protein VMM35_05815 [Longimicrobiales bacterium]|nr:hypothetical protein [Longimicrobiales bacterium]
MSRPIRSRSATKSSTTLLGVVLVATVALCGWLALQAYGAARRTTATWKIEVEADGNFSRDERELDEGNVIVDERTN